MNQNVVKEIRLLWPVWAPALLLAVIPVWLIPSDSSPPPPGFSVFPFLLGAVLLGLSSFGREFSLKTFSLLLAQPAERMQSWRTKVSVLAIAILSTFSVWLLSNLFRVRFNPEPLGQSVIIAIVGMAVAFTGGFWTTLLLRQVVAAFWFSLLIPVTILVAVFALGGEYWVLVTVLGIYSVASLFYGRRLFLRIQEAAWTGGVVSLPGFGSSPHRITNQVRAFRPLAAVCSREFQLYQVSLVGMCCFFFLHLVVVAVRKFGHDSFGPWTNSALDAFGGLWLIIPMLCASMSVAEERKLGTMDSMLCLPVRRGLLFTVKIFFALFFAGFLSAIFFLIAEGFGLLINAGGPLSSQSASSFDQAIFILVGFPGLAFLGFCASTLARSTLQAFALCFAMTFGLWAAAAVVNVSPGQDSILPWSGNLVNYVGLPMLLLTFIWLAWRNFLRADAGWLLWRRQVMSLVGSCVLIGLATTIIYHRAWELFSPIEPAHGPARLGLASRSLFQGDFGRAAALKLPDGRVWLSRSDYVPGRLGFSLSDDSGFRFGGHWQTGISTNVFPGTDWLQVIPGVHDDVGIRSDGTLWVSDKPVRHVNFRSPGSRIQYSGVMTQVGKDSSWKSMVQNPGWPWMIVLLKRDGTLWMIGTNYFSQKNQWPGLRSFEPTQTELGNGWSFLQVGSFFTSGVYLYAWKTDGATWALRIREPDAEVVHATSQNGPGRTIEPGEKIAKPSGLLVAERLPAFDNHHWESLARVYLTDAAVRDDGTLWYWETNPGEDRKMGRPFSPKPLQVGRDDDWVTIASGWENFVALKKDGSLWQWFRVPHATPLEVGRALSTAPIRMSKHSDWVALGSGSGGVFSLSADGGYWFWWDRQQLHSFVQPMMLYSRRPVLLGNVFSE